MQIKSQPQKAINTNLEGKISENEKIEFICEELTNICTVSYQLITPKISQKLIRKKKIMKKQNKNDFSLEETSSNQNKQSNQNCFNDTQEGLISQITLINDLQSKLLYLKMMISKM